MSTKLVYGLGRVSDVTVEIVKRAYQKDTDRKNNPITFISAIGKSKNLRLYTKLVENPETKVMEEVEATAEPRITLFCDKRVSPDVFEQLKSAPEGAILEVGGELASKNFPDHKGDREYPAFYGAVHVTSLKVISPTS